MQPGYKPEPADTFTRFVGKFRSKCWAVGSEWQKKWHRIDDANSFLYKNVSGDLTNDTDPSPNYFRLIMLYNPVYIICNHYTWRKVLLFYRCTKRPAHFPDYISIPPPSTMINQFCDDWWRLMTATTRSGYILHCTVYYEYDSCYA